MTKSPLGNYHNELAILILSAEEVEIAPIIDNTLSGDNVDCWMEIQQGKGPWASPVTGIVPLGTTLTMVVGIDDKEGTKIIV